LAYLREAYESRVSDEFVFPGRNLAKPISNMTMLKHLKEITEDETLTVHGFRTTFRTWAQEETDFEEEIVEHCLHHITGGCRKGVQARRGSKEAGMVETSLEAVALCGASLLI
jgi:integrase